MRTRAKRRKTRYVVQSLTGFPINVNAAANTGHQRTFWYVLDSQVCYRIVQECIGQAAERKARDLAAGLNAEHENYLWEIAQ